MEEYFSQADEFLWLDEALPRSVNQHQSAFMTYSSQILQGFRSENWGNHAQNDENINRKVMEFLKKSWKPTAIRPFEADRKGNHRHMMDERMRRVKQKEGFIELHKMLPLGTKGDKNSIVQMAAKRIQELQKNKDELKRRNIELEFALAAVKNEDDDEEEVTLEEAKINLRVAHPSSGIDSMVEVLKCLKNTGTKIKAMQSNFSSKEFSALLQIEAKIGAAQVEKAVHESLFEVERKFQCPFPSEKYSQRK